MWKMLRTDILSEMLSFDCKYEFIHSISPALSRLFIRRWYPIPSPDENKDQSGASDEPHQDSDNGAGMGFWALGVRLVR